MERALWLRRFGTGTRRTLSENRNEHKERDISFSSEGKMFIGGEMLWCNWNKTLRDMPLLKKAETGSAQRRPWFSAEL